MMMFLLCVFATSQCALIVISAMIWREMRAGRSIEIRLPDNLRIVDTVEEAKNVVVRDGTAVSSVETHHSVTHEEPAHAFSPIASTLLLIDRDGIVKHECTIHRKEIPAFHTYGGKSYQRIGQRSDHVYEYTEVV